MHFYGSGAELGLDLLEAYDKGNVGSADDNYGKEDANSDGNVRH